MPIGRTLALTPSEFSSVPQAFPGMGWLSCRFSAEGRGLENLPQRLPRNSLLILDDSTPMAGHDPEKITAQLLKAVEKFRCSGLLLDFEKAGNRDQQALAHHLTETLPCPVAVSEAYGRDLDCPLFLSLIPPYVSLPAYITPWKGRELWLELGISTCSITLTPGGASIDQAAAASGKLHCDSRLHCHYSVSLSPGQVIFTLTRTKEDLRDLIQEAESLGISRWIGLWQELK